MATDRPSKDSMKSTWHTASRDTWTTYHWIIHLLGVDPHDSPKQAPVHSKSDKIPYFLQWSAHRFILFYAALPLVLHQAYAFVTGRTLNPIATFSLYFLSINYNVIVEARVIARLGYIYGFLDGDKAPRDGIPDVGVTQVALSLVKTTGSRLVLAIYLSYNRNQLPFDLNWKWLLVEMSLYGIVLDFWFYWYHRSAHDVGFLWKYHRRHHLTKHPNSLLAAYSDHEQEVVEMVMVPLLTYSCLKLVGLPMSFYEWWICQQYVVFSEIIGHSGLRLHLTAPSPVSWLLEMGGAALVVEDHDLHHRKGWRKSHNYGKQTRLWDTVFGTTHERIESSFENVDYTNTAEMPLW